MGVSTDGQLCYGIVFPEGFQFPWDGDEGGGGDEEDWWMKKQGYKELFQLYSEDGEGYAPGIQTVKGQYGRIEVAPEDKHKVDEYYEHRRKFKEEHPFPVKLVNYCSGDCSMYIVAVADSVKSNSRGYPMKIVPNELKVTDEEKQGLIDFCEKYLKEQIDEHNEDEYNKDEQIVLEPEWWLSSYWG